MAAREGRQCDSSSNAGVVGDVALSSVGREYLDSKERLHLAQQQKQQQQDSRGHVSV